MRLTAAEIPVLASLVSSEVQRHVGSLNTSLDKAYNASEEPNTVRGELQKAKTHMLHALRAERLLGKVLAQEPAEDIE